MGPNTDTNIMKLVPPSILLLCLFFEVQGHARLMEPPSRASMWRLGFDNPADYNDNEGFCGGFQHQQFEMGGRCGICGDPFDAPIRQHEAPFGKYANGIIVRQFLQGQSIDVQVDVTSNHKGHFVFKLCANNDVMQDPDQDCFDSNVMQIVGIDDEKYVLPDQESRTFDLKIQLPKDISCDQCILQWTYVTANSWGIDEDGIACVGCGPQENFRSCADIKIIANENGTNPVETTTESFETTTDQLKTTSSQQQETTTEPDFEISKPCQALPPYNKIDTMAKWCNDNCPRGFCPENMCLCQ